jgi:hypothetical protein
MKRLSLKPLRFEEAISNILKIRPEPKPLKQALKTKPKAEAKPKGRAAKRNG